MADVLTELVAKITTDASGLKSGMAQAEGVTEKSSQAMQASLRKVGMAMVAVGAAITGAMGLALKASSDYESAFTGVRKTVNATEAEFANLSKGIIDMSKTLPISAGDLAAIAESAGQLGIETKSILGFTEVIAGLGMATNLAGQEGATMLARFANITGMAQDDFSKLGSAIVDLGNNFATTEAEIVTMSMQLAGTGTIIGLSETEIMAMATTLTSLGVKAERGGTSFSQMMMEMNSAVSGGGEKLKIWADIAGVSAEQFATMFREDAMGTIVDVIGGLNNLNESGSDTAGVLESLGLGGIRVTDSLFRMANNEELLNNAIKTANDAWEKDIALKEEVDKRNKTLASQMTILKNTTTAFAISIGDTLAPVIQGFIGLLKPIIDGITNWAKAHPQLTQFIVLTTTAIGLLLLGFGSFLLLVPPLLAGMAALGLTFSAMIWPVTLVVAAVAALVAIGIVVVKNFNAIKLAVLNAIDTILSKLEPFLPFLGKLRQGIADMIAADEVKAKAKEVEDAHAAMVEQLKEDAAKLTGALKDEANKRYNAALDALKKERDAATETYNAEVDAIKSKYGEAKDVTKSLIQLEYDKRDAVIQATKDGERVAEDAYNNEVRRINDLYRLKISQAQQEVSDAQRAIQDQIDAIDDLTAAEDLATDRAEEKAKLANLKSAIDSAATDEDKAIATAKYAEYETEIKRKELLRSRAAEKDALRDTIQDLRDGLDAQKESLEKQRDRELEESQKAYITDLENKKSAWAEAETIAETNLQAEITRLGIEKQAKLDTLKEEYEGENGVFAKLDETEKTLTANHNLYLTQLDAELKKFTDDQTAKYDSARAFVDGLNALVINDKSYTVTRYERTEESGGGSLNYSPDDNYAGGFATGGVVPGPIGMPQLATVHGGETIIPANESMGGVTVNISGPLFMEREDQMNQLVDKIRKGIQRQDRLRFGGAYSG